MDAPCHTTCQPQGDARYRSKRAELLASGFHRIQDGMRLSDAVVYLDHILCEVFPDPAAKHQRLHSQQLDQ